MLIIDMTKQTKPPIKKPKTPTEATAEKAYYKLMRKLQEEKKKQKKNNNGMNFCVNNFLLFIFLTYENTITRISTRKDQPR